MEIFGSRPRSSQEVNEDKDLTMTTLQQSILLVEDNQADADYMREVLDDSRLADRNLIHVVTLRDAIEFVENEACEVILLDLILPDSGLTETVERMRYAAPKTPVVVLSGSDDDEIIFLALRCGAQDYLIKGQYDADLLRRAIVYSIERQRLITELEEERREREQLHREYMHLESLLEERTTDTTASMFGIVPIWRSSPELFEELRVLYDQLLDQALKSKTLSLDISTREHDRLLLKELCDRLGAMRAGPRDILDIHMRTMQMKSDSCNAKKAAVYADEGRYILVQVMGRLVSYYRSNPIIVRTAGNGDDHEKLSTLKSDQKS